MGTAIEHMHCMFMSCQAVTRTYADVDLEGQMFYIGKNNSSYESTCAQGMCEKHDDTYSKSPPGLSCHEWKDWHQNDLSVSANAHESTVISVCENENVTKLIQDPVWYCPEDVEASDNKAYACHGFDLNTSYGEDFIDEDNLLLGTATEHVPRPAQFVTVVTESCDQVVPYLSTCLSSEENLLQLVPLWDDDSESDTDRSCPALDLPDNYKSLTEASSFYCSLSYSVSSDEEVFGLVPQLDLQISHLATGFSLSRVTDGLDDMGTFPSSVFDLDVDILSDDSEEVDRPINSCSAQDFSVPIWAVEE